MSRGKKKQKWNNKKPKKELCNCCGFQMDDNGYKQKTFHHFIPKVLRDKPEDELKGTYICRACHRAFHKTVDFNNPTEDKEYYYFEYLYFRGLLRMKIDEYYSNFSNTGL